MYNDPAIIQLHYSQATSTSLPSSGFGPLQDLSSHASLMGLPNSSYQINVPFYQPNGSSGPWVAPLPSRPTNGSGLASNPSFQGFSLLPSSQSEPAPPFVTGTLNFHSSLFPEQSSAVASGLPTALMSNKPITQGSFPNAFNTCLPSVSLPTNFLENNNTLVSAVPSKPNTAYASATQYNVALDPDTGVAGTTGSLQSGESTPYLVTPSQLLQPGHTKSFLSQSLLMAEDDIVVSQVSSPELPVSIVVEDQAPILPLPSPPSHNYKLHGAPSHFRHGNRGRRERIGPNGILHHTTRFTEDFDFLAMNEKFNKDEVWGQLGQSNKAQGGGSGSQDESDAGPSKFEFKPAYVKDDFFDSLSSNALDQHSHSERPRFSEQRKIDVETFGAFARHRGGHGGRGLGRGVYSRGSYYARSYGYIGKGRGHRT
ncbi:hypothetical protein NMG60_11006223 [Bertholletia excelsa]